jgi:hypothetical protein
MQRINELNGRIQVVSQLPDRQRYQPAIVEMLGLCGHLHGELVRIHQMIAADDPELKVGSHYALCLQVSRHFLLLDRCQGFLAIDFN